MSPKADDKVTSCGDRRLALLGILYWRVHWMKYRSQKRQRTSVSPIFMSTILMSTYAHLHPPATVHASILDYKDLTTDRTRLEYFIDVFTEWKTAVKKGKEHRFPGFSSVLDYMDLMKTDADASPLTQQHMTQPTSFPTGRLRVWRNHQADGRGSQHRPLPRGLLPGVRVLQDRVHGVLHPGALCHGRGVQRDPPGRPHWRRGGGGGQHEEQKRGGGAAEPLAVAVRRRAGHLPYFGGVILSDVSTETEL